MKKIFHIFLAAFVILILYGFTAWYVGLHGVDVLDPRGMIGKKERDLFYIALSLMMIVVIPVCILAALFTKRYRDGNKKAKYTPDWDHSKLAEVVWWGVPICIIAVLSLFIWYSSHELNPFRPIESNKKPLTVQVVALDWKWLFLYPEEGVAAVNFMQFPVNTPVAFEITADAPMNSFWIPQLGGQIYAMPAKRSALHLIADREGEYRGVSSNINGKGFAGMTFTAKADGEEAFAAWVREIEATAPPLTFEEYEKLAEPSEYNPPAFYTLPDSGLFEKIINKYRG